MSKNYCNCPNCQTDNCPAGADLARALADIEMLRQRPIVEGGQAGYDRLRAELEAAKAKLECAELQKWVAMCEESRLGIVLPLPPLVQTLKDENDRLTADNARLAAYVKRLRTSLNNLAAESAPSDWLKDAYDLLSPELEKDCSTALRDLLVGPKNTVLHLTRILKDVALTPSNAERWMAAVQEAIQEGEEELARLRAVVERK